LLETSVNGDYKNYISSAVEDRAPAFSPDGQHIALAFRSNDGSRDDIYRINSDGSGRVRLTDIPLWETVGPIRLRRRATCRRPGHLMAGRSPSSPTGPGGGRFGPWRPTGPTSTRSLPEK